MKFLHYLFSGHWTISADQGKEGLDRPGLWTSGGQGTKTRSDPVYCLHRGQTEKWDRRIDWTNDERRVCIEILSTGFCVESRTVRRGVFGRHRVTRTPFASLRYIWSWQVILQDLLPLQDTDTRGYTVHGRCIPMVRELYPDQTTSLT